MATTSIDATGVSSEYVMDAGGLGGHPRGLSTLFLTEMWERFSFYGMRAILLLYMTKPLAEGGLAFNQKYAGLIYSTYASSVYWTPLIGGWLADRFFGTRRAVFIGGVVIACGHFSMAFDTRPNFYGGLALIALGTGLLKPNISAMVGQMYAPGDARRDAGFSIFYMGINLGAFIAPLVCGYLGQRVDWHYGFAAAGFGMVIGLVQYALSGNRLRGIGDRPAQKGADISATKGIADESVNSDTVTIGLALVGAVAGFALGFFWGGDDLLTKLLTSLFPTVVGLFVGYIVGVVRHLAADELKRVLVIFILFIFSAIFWASYEQAATSLTLFADRLTRTNILGFEFPSSWFQSVPALFVIALAPLFAWFWISLGRCNPSSPAKFAYGLLFAGIAFVVIAFASTLTGIGKVSPLWLVLVYFLQTIGEMCLSPVGLSTVTKLSPARMVGLMMGVWFLSISVGNYIAGWASGFFDEKAEGALLQLFGVVALVSIIAAVALFLLTPSIKRLSPRSE
ncbi:MAG: peptide MFS transporter [Pyrinomonadaceae bacterium]